MQKQERGSQNVAVAIGGGLAGIVAVVGGAAVGWGAYSALSLDHQLPLEPAIAAEQRRFRSATAGEINYYVAREAAGRPLVLVHSVNAAASAYEMRPLFDAFRGHRPVYALDLPGFGFSERTDRDYSPALYTAALVQRGLDASVVSRRAPCLDTSS